MFVMGNKCCIATRYLLLELQHTRFSKVDHLCMNKYYLLNQYRFKITNFALSEVLSVTNIIIKLISEFIG